MTRLGGEAALPDPAWEAGGTTDLLLSGTLRQYDDLLRSLSVASPELRRIGVEIELVLERDSTPARTIETARGPIVLDRTLVMGVLNVTPDSFSDGGLYLEPKDALHHAEQMEADGADVIDIGAVSSRPGAEDVPEKEETDRLRPVLEQLAERASVPLCIDTTRASVARFAVDHGVAIVNDISALTKDPAMADVVVETGAACVLMHMRGTPATMNQQTDYGDLVSEVNRYLAERAAWATARGIQDNRLLVDPGIGFAKTADQSMVVLQRLGELRSLGLPVVVGTSRKSFIGRALGREVGDRLAGTLATLAWAVFQGARVVRVHDVGPAVDAVRMADAMLAAAE